MAYDEEQFRRVVIEALQIPASSYKPDLRLGDIEEWDSVAHLDLVASIEQAFNIRLSADELVELTGLDELRMRIKRAA
jgi:acyl carrier protein